MSKDFKQRIAYKYLHGDLKEVPANVQKWWDRHNFNVGEARKQRNDDKAKDIDKLTNQELNKL